MLKLQKLKFSWEREADSKRRFDTKLIKKDLILKIFNKKLLAVVKIFTIKRKLLIYGNYFNIF